MPLLEANRELRAVALYEEMMRRHPELDAGVRRTLERRVRGWKAKRGPDREIIFRQKHQPGRRGLSDFTDSRWPCVPYLGSYQWAQQFHPSGILLPRLAEYQPKAQHEDDERERPREDGLSCRFVGIGLDHLRAIEHLSPRVVVWHYPIGDPRCGVCQDPRYGQDHAQQNADRSFSLHVCSFVARVEAPLSPWISGETIPQGTSFLQPSQFGQR